MAKSDSLKPASNSPVKPSSPPDDATSEFDPTDIDQTFATNFFIEMDNSGTQSGTFFEMDCPDCQEQLYLSLQEKGRFKDAERLSALINRGRKWVHQKKRLKTIVTIGLIVYFPLAGLFFLLYNPDLHYCIQHNLDHYREGLPVILQLPIVILLAILAIGIPIMIALIFLMGVV